MPSEPNIKDNRTIDLHIDTFNLENGILTIKTMKEDLKSLLIEYEHAIEELKTVKNSKLLISDELYLILIVSKDVYVEEHENKLIIDLNEDTIDCLLIEKERATLFTIRHDIREIRMNYRRINKSISEEDKRRKKIQRKYGKRERNRVYDRLNKITTMIADLALAAKADLVREKIKDMRKRVGSK